MLEHLVSEGLVASPVGAKGIHSHSCSHSESGLYIYTSECGMGASQGVAGDEISGCRVPTLKSFHSRDNLGRDSGVSGVETLVDLGSCNVFVRGLDEIDIGDPVLNVD